MIDIAINIGILFLIAAVAAAFIDMLNAFVTRPKKDRDQ